MSQTILLKGHPVRKEVEAGGTVTPGMQIDFDGTAGGGARTAFALENDIVGGDIDDDYSSGDTVQVGVFGPGDEVNALLANGENVSAGDALEGVGDGELQAFGSGDVVAYALEALNNTSGSAARLKVEVA